MYIGHFMGAYAFLGTREQAAAVYRMMAPGLKGELEEFALRRYLLLEIERPLQMAWDEANETARTWARRAVMGKFPTEIDLPAPEPAPTG